MATTSPQPTFARTPSNAQLQEAKRALGGMSLQEQLEYDAAQREAREDLLRYKVMNTRYLTANGNEYPIYLDTKTGTYFITDKTGKRSDFTNPAGIALISQNKDQTISKENYANKSGTPLKDFTDSIIKQHQNLIKATTNINPGPATETISDTETNSKKTNEGVSGSGGSGTAPSPSDKYYQQIIDTYNDIRQRLYDLEHPQVLSAREAAEHFDIPYDEALFLQEYNDKTHAFYDDMMAEQNRLRDVYARNNAQYAQQLANSYLDSYKNAAPTATGKGVRAANALSSMLQNQQSINENDYGMLQSYNNLASARDAELANNPLLAKEKYNKLGTYLSTLTANKNASDVKQYVDQLDAYGQMYAANRLLAAADAESAATRYSGLTSAAQSNAQSAANGYNATNNFQQLYNLYYNTSNGNNRFASNKVANLINQGLQLGGSK